MFSKQYATATCCLKKIFVDRYNGYVNNAVINTPTLLLKISAGELVLLASFSEECLLEQGRLFSTPFNRPVNLKFSKPGDSRFFVEKNREIWPKKGDIWIC